MYFLPSFDLAQEIVSKNENFYHRKYIVDGFELSDFGYDLPGYMDFFDPFKTGKVTDFNALEMRGLTFINNQPYRLLHKFFTFNQTKGVMLADIKNKKIKSIQEKIDGSVIRFLRLPSGRVISRSKARFVGHPHTNMAMSIYEADSNLQAFINATLDDNKAAVFELVAPDKQVVVPYDTTGLRLLQVREESTGKYLDIYNDPIVTEFEKNGSLSKTPSFDFTLDQLVNYKGKNKGMEGWVVQFEDGQFVKIKTDWYGCLHSLVVENVRHAKTVAELVLCDALDDAIGYIEDQDTRQWVLDIASKISDDYRKIVSEVNSVLSENIFKEDDKVARGNFARKYNKHEFFDYIIQAVQVRSDPDKVLQSIKNGMLKKYKVKM